MFLSLRFLYEFQELQESSCSSFSRYTVLVIFLAEFTNKSAVRVPNKIAPFSLILSVMDFKSQTFLVSSIVSTDFSLNTSEARS